MLVAIVVTVALRAPSAAHDFVRAFASIKLSRLPWLAGAVAAEFASFAFYARIQGMLLRAGDEHVPMSILLRLAIASSGLRALLPAGVLPSSGWLYGQYRRIDTPPELTLFVLLASGFVSTVTLLVLLLLGAAIAGTGGAVLLGVSGLVLVGGSAGFVYLVHRLALLERLVEGHRGRVVDLVRRGLRFGERVAICRVGWWRGTITFADAAGNWLADAVCLIGAFSMLGQPIPWRGLLFAYTASQLAGSVIPLPGGLGAVEGGLVGALDLSGVPVGSALAAALVYRVVTYWGVSLIGGIELIALARHPVEEHVTTEE